MDIKINRATALMTGGNCYVFYAELEDGNWMYGNEDCLTIVDSNPIADEETFEASARYEWQIAHFIEDIPIENIRNVLAKILETIYSGRIIEDFCYCSVADLRRMFGSLGCDVSFRNNANAIYTRDEAAHIVELFENVLDRYDIKVPSPDDEFRDPDNDAKLYGTTYAELIDNVEAVLISLINKYGNRIEPVVVTREFSGTY